MSKIPSTRLLSSINATGAAFLGSANGTVVNYTTTDDGAGGWTLTASGTTVTAMRINPAGGLTVNVAGAAVTEGVHFTAIVAGTVTIDLKSQILYGGNTYQVREILHDGNLTWDAFTKVSITRLV